MNKDIRLLKVAIELISEKALGKISQRVVQDLLDQLGKDNIKKPIKITVDNWYDSWDKNIWVGDDLFTPNGWLRDYLIGFNERNTEHPVKTSDSCFRHAYTTDPREWLKQEANK